MPGPVIIGGGVMTAMIRFPCSLERAATFTLRDLVPSKWL